MRSGLPARAVGTGTCGKAVRFIADDGVRLDGILFRESKASDTCIVYLHGMGGSMISGLTMAIAEAIGDKAALFAFNNRGHDSEASAWKFYGKRRKRVRIGVNFERFEDSVNDISGAIRCLRKMGFRKFVLCGHSTGCQKVTYYQYRTRDATVAGLALLAPCDDYNLNRRSLGRRYAKSLAEVRGMVRKRDGDSVLSYARGMSAQRYDSVIDPRRAEARIFDYEGRLAEFGKVKVPILAVFGAEEEFRLMPVKKYLSILQSRSSSVSFSAAEIGRAGHSFEGREADVAKAVSLFALKASRR